MLWDFHARDGKIIVGIYLWVTFMVHLYQEKVNRPTLILLMWTALLQSQHKPIFSLQMSPTA